MSKLSVTKVYQLGLMTVAYIVGELTHFLVNTTSKSQVNRMNPFLNEEKMGGPCKVIGISFLFWWFILSWYGLLTTDNF